MVYSWWWFWLVFMFLFLLPPVGYGWGYRGWGPPYPRYLQRRRAERAAAAAGELPPYNHLAWGLGGDLLWIILMVWMFWAIVAVW
jgi:hypothetical protein